MKKVDVVREAPLCECGCGERVKQNKDNGRWNIYLFGHQNRGKKHSEKTKKKIAEAHIGEKFTEERCKNISEANKGRVFTEEHKKKLSEAHKGVPLSESHRRNSAEAHKGIKCSEEKKRKISESLKGHPMYIERIKDRSGEDGYCDQWWDWEFRVSCKKGHCEKCGMTVMLSLKVYSMWLGNHHIDFNKMNCHPNNLQTLCVSCHSKLHHAERKK